MEPKPGEWWWVKCRHQDGPQPMRTTADGDWEADPSDWLRHPVDGDTVTPICRIPTPEELEAVDREEDEEPDHHSTP